MRKLLVSLILILGFAFVGHAQQTDSELDFAFSQLKTNGPVPFSTALFDTNGGAARHLQSQLTPLVANAGDYIGYEVVSRKPLTSRIDRIVLAIYYQRCAVFMRIDSYQSASSRRFLSAFATDDADKVLPAEIIAVTGR